MSSNPIFDAAREALRQGDTAKAIELVISHLEAGRHHAETLRTLRVVEANYHAARQQEVKGILTFSEAQREYNKLNDNLLAILDALTEGKKTSPTSASPTSRARWPVLVGIGVLALAALLGAWWFLRKNAAPDCPEFRGQGLRVLILPFQNVGSTSNDAKPEVVLQSRIEERSRSNDFPLSVEVMTDFNAAKHNPDLYDAQPLGKTCGADMVIWGLYDKSGDNIQLDTRFAFVKPDGASGGTGFQVFASVPNIHSGKMLKGLDDAVFSLCAIMALREKRLPLVKKWLEKVVVKDERDSKVLAKLQQMDSTTTGRKGLIQKKIGEKTK